MPLGNLPLKTTPQALALFLANPLHVRPSGRMPSLSLTAEEARAIAVYLLRDQAGKRNRRTPRSWSMPARPGAGATCSRASAVPPATIPAAARNRERLDLVLLGADGRPASHRRDNRSPPNESRPPRHRQQSANQVPELRQGRQRPGHDHSRRAPVLVTGLELTSANDSPGRDPASYLLEGSLDGKSFRAHRRAHDSAVSRIASRPRCFAIDNDEVYSVYRLTFPTLREGKGADAMQIAEVRLLASPQAAAWAGQHIEGDAAGEAESHGGRRLPGETCRAAGKPRFAFSAGQRAGRAHRPWRTCSKPAVALTAGQRLDQTMTALNCYACHRRGNKGGPDAQASAYFTYEVVVDLGDEGRLPPALHEVGAKLTRRGSRTCCCRPVRYRTSMATRMPLFGKANVGHLPELFREADAGKVPAVQAGIHAAHGRGRPASSRATRPWPASIAMPGAATGFPGPRGSTCCRRSSDCGPSGSMPCSSIRSSSSRAPRMPGGWPKGKSFFPEIEKGDMHRQIDAIWAYLSVGERGGPPSGLILDKSRLLVPGDEPIVFRTFLDGVSAHAILVGFREKTHVAFDANRVRTVLAWTGDFITTEAAWEGRGGMYAKLLEPGRGDLPGRPAAGEPAEPDREMAGRRAQGQDGHQPGPGRLAFPRLSLRRQTHAHVPLPRRAP